MKTKALLIAAVLLVMIVTPRQSLALADNAGVPVAAGESGEVLRLEADYFQGVEDGLQGIIITELPASGTLRFNGRPLMEGEAVTTATLDMLSYMPSNSFEVSTGFAYLPVFADGVSDKVERLGIQLVHTENLPPQADDMELQTYKNIMLMGRFSASDPDGDMLTFRITTKPKRGEMEIMEDGSFRYTPFPNKTGTDTITYVAADSHGNTSGQARITIKIEKPATKTTYADMEGNPEYYAALRLVENEIFTGEQISGVHYFNPDAIVTRGEFIVMAMRAVGLDGGIAQTTVTGFADDSGMASWLKPYAQTALKSGIVCGVETADGRKMLMADNPVTVAEATVILNKATDMAHVTVIGGREISDAVPAWAEQAAFNMDAAGVVRASGVEDWNAPLTRAQAASMLVRSMEIQSMNQEEKGLLSWVFGW